MSRFSIVVLLASILAACGGTAARKPSVNNNFAGGGSPPGSAVVVNAAANQTDAGVDITVPAPAASPAPNAKFLGTAGTAAFTTGDTIHRGQTTNVLLFGPGLSGNMQVRISGPGDIAVTGVHTITANDAAHTPGVEFTAAVSPSAALGGRTVLLINSQGDITTFTGGLEVIP